MTLILSGTNGITSVNGTAAAPSVTGTDTDTGIVYGTNTVTIATNGTAGLLQDASQNIGLGVVPSAWFALQKNIQIGGNFSGTPYAGALASQTNDAVTTLFNNAYINSSNADTYYSSGSNEAAKYQIFRSNHRWYSAPAGTAGNAITFTQVLGVTKDATMTLQGGTSSAGTGIAFPATQSASTDVNTLDDYEEGSWTPTLSGSSGSITLTSTARYTKIGNLVLITAGMGWSSSTLTGQIILGGFPFPLNNSAAGYRSAASFGYVSGITFSGQLISDATAGNTQGVIFYAVSNSAPSNIALQSNGNMQFTLVYKV